MTQRIRVFISSPGDVQMERLRASLVIDKLAQDYRRFFTIEAYLWEHEPMLSAAHFQDAIEPPSAFDIVVLILWSRLGTPLPEATAAARVSRRRRPRAGHRNRVGVRGRAARGAASAGLPDLMVFRNTSKAPIDTQDPAARAQAIAQLDGARHVLAPAFRRRRRVPLRVRQLRVPGAIRRAARGSAAQGDRAAHQGAASARRRAASRSGWAILSAAWKPTSSSTRRSSSAATRRSPRRSSSSRGARKAERRSCWFRAPAARANRRWSRPPSSRG